MPVAWARTGTHDAGPSRGRSLARAIERHAAPNHARRLSATASNLPTVTRTADDPQRGIPAAVATLRELERTLAPTRRALQRQVERAERRMAPVRVLLAEAVEAETAGFDRLHPSETLGRRCARYRAHRTAHRYLDLLPGAPDHVVVQLQEAPAYVRICASVERRASRVDRRRATESCVRVLVAAPNAPGTSPHGNQG